MTPEDSQPSSERLRVRGVSDMWSCISEEAPCVSNGNPTHGVWGQCRDLRPYTAPHGAYTRHERLRGASGRCEVFFILFFICFFNERQGTRPVRAARANFEDNKGRCVTKGHARGPKQPRTLRLSSLGERPMFSDGHGVRMKGRKT